MHLPGWAGIQFRKARYRIAFVSWQSIRGHQFLLNTFNADALLTFIAQCLQRCCACPLRQQFRWRKNSKQSVFHLHGGSPHLKTWIGCRKAARNTLRKEHKRIVEHREELLWKRSYVSSAGQACKTAVDELTFLRAVERHFESTPHAGNSILYLGAPGQLENIIRHIVECSLISTDKS